MAELGEANIGGRMVPAWLLNLTAEELDSLKSKWYSNPNLLDNWYFGNPVNQRGVSSGTEWGGSKYGLDRWVAFSAGVCWDSNGYIVFPPRLENNLIYQRLEKSRLIVGSKITLSLLTDDGNLIFNTVTYAGNTIYGVLSGTIFGNTTIVVTNDYVEIRIWYTENNASEGHLAAAKLELGSTQTLAHREGDKWVLNEIPDYGEQLRRCQRYFVNFNPYKMAWFAMPPAVASNSGQAYSAVTLPVAMRTQPVVSYGGNIVLSQEGDHVVTAILVSDSTFTGNSIQLRYDVSAGTLTANSLYRVQGYQDATSYIWLSADL